MKNIIVIISLLFASHYLLSQNIYHLDKKKAPALQFVDMTNPPEKSVTNTLTTLYDTKIIPKTDEFKVFPKPKKANFKNITKLESDFAERQKRELLWEPEPIKFRVKQNLPDFLFKDNSLRNIKYLDKAHGFISNSVTSICEDSLGVIWLATSNKGICRLIGSEMNVLDMSSGLSSNSINDLLIDSKGRMWISSSSGLMYLYDNILYQASDEALSNAFINSVYEDGEGNIWIATNGNGAIKYNGELLEVFEKNSGLPGNLVNAILEDKSGNIWFALNADGLCVYDGESFTTYVLSDSDEYNSVKSLYQSDEGLWIGHFQSPLIKYVNGDFYTYKLFSGREPTIYSFAENEFGLWLAAYGKGLINLNNGKYKLYSPIDGLVGKNAYGVFIDSKNNIWTGDLISGLSRFDENLFYANNVSQGIPLRNAAEITSDRDGNIWYLPNGQNLIKEDATHYTVYDNSKYMPLFALHHAFDGEFMPNGDIFLSTYSMGILKITNSHFEYTKFDSGNFVMESSSYEPNEIWFSTMQNGLKKYDYKSYYDITTFNGLSGNAISCIKHDKNGNLWVGVSGMGVDIINGNAIAHLDVESGLLSNNTTFIYPEEDKMWIGTDAGINIIEGDSMLTLTKSSGLLSNQIRSIIRDSKDNYWIASSDGLSKLKFMNNKAVHIKNYGIEHGLNITDFNSSVYLMDDGRIWWGTNHSIITAYPENYNDHDFEIKLNLESFVFSDTTIYNINFSSDHLLVKPDKSVIINYFATNWGNEKNLTYEYALLKEEEIDTFWTDNGNNTQIVLKDMPTGEYQLLIRALTDGKVSNTKTVNIVFKPHWWESMVFIVLVFIFFAIVGPLVFLLYSYNSRKKRLRLEKIVNEKTNELIEENKIKDALVQEIHHRVKNNLQSITSLVEMQIFSTQNDMEKKALADVQLRISAMAIVHEMLYSSTDIGKVSAKKYLNELVNSINEMSNTDKLPIQFNLEVEDFDIGMSNCISFGLLTSEIISNSIKYAFDNISKPAINLSFHYSETEITYIIRDNGVGFNPDEINQDESLGLRLIDIFAKQLNSKIDYEFNNGTMVKLIIPKQNLD